MNNNKSLKKNLFYNLSLNFINVLFPIITLPYVSKTLGANNLGKCNFSSSFATWFLIFAIFGTNSYGIREVSKVRDNKANLNKTFSEIFFINLITTIITLIIYITIIFINPRTNMELPLFIVSALFIFMNLFCVDWFYMGIENFKLITLRSLVVKIICLISIFIFIRNQNDYVIYSLITVIAFGLANIFNFIYSKNYVKLIYKDIDFKKHIKKLSIFFISSLVISVYSTLDQVFLGFNSSNESVALFARTRQVYSIALSITLSISTVLFPKLTSMFQNDFCGYEKLLKKSINYIYIFSIPSVFGLILLSKDIMLFLGGIEFEGAYLSLIIAASSVFTVSLGNWQLNQLLLPLGKEKVGLKGQIIIAIVSIISNIILVPRFKYIGASISLVLAETSGTVYGTYYIKSKIKQIKFSYITDGFIKYLVASLIMSFVLIVYEKLTSFKYITNILVSTIIGSIVYFGLLYLFKDEIINEIISYMNNKYAKRFKSI